MTRKQRRVTMLFAGGACLSTAAVLVLNAFRDNIVFFYSPSELAAKAPEIGRPIRIGGLVEAHTLRHLNGNTVTFRITDGKHDVAVAYSGILPDLFREGQGVVAEGAVDTAGRFEAATILAKHDEKYMPPEVAAALKRSGQWRGDAAASAAASPAIDPFRLAQSAPPPQSAIGP